MGSLNNIVLSTATWNEVESKSTYFAILDRSYELGIRKIESAANYPLNVNSKYFRYTENILLEWIRINNIIDLEVFIRAGEVSNLLQNKSFNLSKSFLIMLGDDYLFKFNQNLKCIIISNSILANESEIQESIEALCYINSKSINIGIGEFETNEIYIRALNLFGIKPHYFIDNNQQTFHYTENQVSDIYIDAHNFILSQINSSTKFNSYNQFLKNFYENIHPSINTNRLCGILLPIDNTSMLNYLMEPQK